jgi:hypothetical protein
MIAIAIPQTPEQLVNSGFHPLSFECEGNRESGFTCSRNTEWIPQGENDLRVSLILNPPAFGWASRDCLLSLLEREMLILE